MAYTEIDVEWDAACIVMRDAGAAYKRSKSKADAVALAAALARWEAALAACEAQNAAYEAADRAALRARRLALVAPRRELRARQLSFNFEV